MSKSPLDDEIAGGIVDAIHGDHLHIPLRLVRKIGNLEMAAFIGLAAFLSSCCKDQGGWFFLEQEKDSCPNSESRFKRVGSWRAALGIGKDAQLGVRKKLEKMGYLEVRPSRRKKKMLGLADDADASPASPTVFLQEEVRGAPPRLHFRVLVARYLAWLGS